MAHPVNFMSAVYGNPDKYVWSFGDGGKDYPQLHQLIFIIMKVLLAYVYR